MCGRYSLNVNRDEIFNMEAYDGVDVGEWLGEDHFVPRYNIAPRSQAPVLRRRRPNGNSPEDATDLVLQTMKWGLVPNWSKHEDKSLSTTNARSENLMQGGGMWNSIKGRKRCAVIAQGYYEWLTKGKDKLPHFIKRKDERLLLMAGLWDQVVLEGQTEVLWSFTIVTTEANKEFGWLHERQPVFLTTKEALDTWLDTSSQTWSPSLGKLMVPYHEKSVPLECYQVPKEVGRVGTESSTFIEPISERKDGIQAMFSKQKEAQKSPEKSKGKLKQEPSTPKASTSSKKRNRTPSRSPSVIDLSASSPPAKKTKVEGDDDDGKIKLEPSPSKKTIPRTPTKPKPSPSKTRSAKAAKPPNTPTIDNFFKKR